MNIQALRIKPMPSDQADAYRRGELDANGQAPEEHVSDGSGIPCRHCLSTVQAGDPYLALAYRPFSELQPYAECGPIFLHAQHCPAYNDNANIPEMFLKGEPRIVRGYNSANRIIYGTGKIVEPSKLLKYAGELLSDENVAFVHVRSSQNNCFTFQIDREKS